MCPCVCVCVFSLSQTKSLSLSFGLDPRLWPQWRSEPNTRSWKRTPKNGKFYPLLLLLLFLILFLRHVQLGQTGAGWTEQGGRDVPDGDRGIAQPVHQEAAAAGGNLPLPWLPLPGAGGRGLPEQAHGVAGGPVLHWEDYLHQVWVRPTTFTAYEPCWVREEPAFFKVKVIRYMTVRQGVGYVSRTQRLTSRQTSLQNVSIQCFHTTWQSSLNYYCIVSAHTTLKKSCDKFGWCDILKTCSYIQERL